MSPEMKNQLVVDSFLQAFGKEHPGSGLLNHILDFDGQAW